MNVADQTIVNLYEIQNAPIEDIQQGLDIPLVYIMDVLERKSPKYRTMLSLRKNPIDISTTELPILATSEDISDPQFARIREEALTLALSQDSHPFIRANMLKFLWNKKRPDSAPAISINVQSINLALAKAREIRQEKLSKIEI